MKYIIKNIKDSDKENAQQLELILNNKASTNNEIASIIKERVDNFELNPDIDCKKHSRSRIAIVGCRAMPYGFEAAIRAAIGIEHPVEIVCGTEHQMIEAMREQVEFRNEFEILNRYNIENPILLESKENHPYGWYRKFEKKRF